MRTRPALAGLFIAVVFLALAGPAPCLAADDMGYNVYGDGSASSREVGADTPWLGVAVYDVTEGAAEYRRLDNGVIVTTVGEGTPAEKAGLAAGDVIVSVDGNRVGGLDDFLSVVRSHRPGEEVALEVDRKGEVKSVFVTLGSMRGGGEPYYRDSPTHYPRDYHDYGDHRYRARPYPYPYDDAPYRQGYGGYGYSVCARFYVDVFDTGLRALSTKISPGAEREVTAITAAYRKERIAREAEMRIARVELGELLDSGDPDLRSIRSRLEEVASRMAEIEFLGIRALEDVKVAVGPAAAGEIEDLVRRAAPAGCR